VSLAWQVSAAAEAAEHELFAEEVCYLNIWSARIFIDTLCP
jgi:hypothetical protein